MINSVFLYVKTDKTYCIDPICMTSATKPQTVPSQEDTMLSWRLSLISVVVVHLDLVDLVAILVRISCDVFMFFLITVCYLYLQLHRTV